MQCYGMNEDKLKYVFLLYFFSVLAGTLFVYWPALSGPFLLDDLVHLPQLQGSGAVDDKAAFFKFVFSGDRTPGRFLSFLSLLIDDFAWPSDPYSYKYTNLMFHLLNGVLVFALVKSIFSALSTVKNTNIISLLVMIIWLMHPMQMSTVMYVIQRITILSSTFVLAGLILYIKGRLLLGRNVVLGYILMTTGIGLFGLIALFFKEIAVNVLIYASILEAIVLSVKIPIRSMFFKVWKTLFLFLPISIIALYFILNIQMLNEFTSRRDFTMYERIITEFRVVLDYLQYILAPRLSEFTLYHDDYAVSSSLLNPISTILSLVLILILLGVAWFFRKKQALLSLGLFWFFGGHLLESTFLPIELYFEHRNYLPMLGILMIIAYFGINVVGKLKILIRLLLIIYSCFLVWLCFLNAQVWGNSTLLSNVWMGEHSTSIRAVYDMVRIKLQVGEQEKAREYLHKIQTLHPEKLSVPIFELLNFECMDESSNIVNSEFIEQARSASFDLGVITALQQLNLKMVKGKCIAVSNESYIKLAISFAENKNFELYRKGRSILYESIGRLYLDEKNLNNTMYYLDRSFDVFPRYTLAVQQAILLISAGLYDDAEIYLTKARITKPDNLLRRFRQGKEIDEVQSVIDNIKKNMMDDHDK